MLSVLTQPLIAVRITLAASQKTRERLGKDSVEKCTKCMPKVYQKLHQNYVKGTSENRHRKRKPTLFLPCFRPV